MGDFLGSIWGAITDVIHQGLVVLHDGLAVVFGQEAAWGWAVIGLTVVVRLLLLPLAIKQTRSMRAMQKLQPQIKKLQAKYKVDRDLLKKDPERYRAKKAKLNEEMMALYREEGVNPASGCLPLLAQAPIFFALFRVLRDSKFTELQNADFYFFTHYLPDDAIQGLGGAVNQAGWPGWLLIVLMSATMFLTQRQMTMRSAGDGGPAQQQKILMYVMPVFLAVVSLQFPLGVLLYWVTTNLWQLGQQAVILREVAHDAPGGGSSGNGAKRPKPDRGGGGGATRAGKPAKPKPTKRESNDKPDQPPEDAGRPGGSKRDHLPRRGA